MAKRKETLAIEEALHTICRKNRIYGCEEVTIGFANNGHGNEVADFMSMDAKGTLRCYEIKVTLQDLGSKAHKSWYGHYNYLLVSDSLYKKNPDWEKYIPDFVGISVCFPSSGGMEIVNKRKPVRQELTFYQEIMVKDGFIRSIWYKMWKYRDAADMGKVQGLKAEIREWKRKLQKEADARTREYLEFRKYRHAVRKYRKLTGTDILAYVEEAEVDDEIS